MVERDIKNKVEALLFASGKFIDDDHVAELAELPVKTVKEALLELKEEFDQSNGSIMLVSEGSSWKMNVKENYIDLVRKIVADTELSKTVLETLAVIAWKTPALQSDVIKIRTNKAYEHISELIEAGFITKEKYGRSYMIKLTEKFFEYFDLEGTEDIKDIFKKVEAQNKEKLKKIAEMEEQQKLAGLEVYEGADSEHTRDLVAEKIEQPQDIGLQTYEEDAEQKEVISEEEPEALKEAEDESQKEVEEQKEERDEEPQKEQSEAQKMVERIENDIDEIEKESSP